MAANEYDVIIVGGGHNGLVAAAYFGRAGARTLVLEARDRVGGAADTSAPFSEFPEDTWDGAIRGIGVTARRKSRLSRARRSMFGEVFRW
jgi:thioredoxin reductase